MEKKEKIQPLEYKVKFYVTENKGGMHLHLDWGGEGKTVEALLKGSREEQEEMFYLATDMFDIFREKFTIETIEYLKDR